MKYINLYKQYNLILKIFLSVYHISSLARQNNQKKEGAIKAPPLLFIQKRNNNRQ
jgi:hypothetical protein